jgi:Phage Tail Collar Domain
MKNITKATTLTVAIIALGGMALYHSAAEEPKKTEALAPATAPIGSITAFAGPVSSAFEAQSGWMICDGRSLDRIKQPGLFAVIGSSWGG